jgi:uncharacterized membrane protein
MNQQETNEAEWRNAENWRLGLYSSRKDSRVIVPKRIRGLGWTVNFGRPAGVALLLAILIGIPLLTILIVLVTRSK